MIMKTNHRQKTQRAEKEMAKFEAWMNKIQNVNVASKEKMANAYERVYNHNMR